MNDQRPLPMVMIGFAAGVLMTVLYVRVLPPAWLIVTPPPVITTAVAADAMTPLKPAPGGGALMPATPSHTASIPAVSNGASLAKTKPTPKPTPTPTPTPPRTAAAKKAASKDVSNIDAGGSMQLIIPVQGIRPEQLRDTYSDARGSGRVHDAIDIMAAHNTPVLAAAPAVVLKQDHGARGGIALYAIAADQRTIYYYAHLDRYAEGVVKGTALRAGDVIGYVGNTGNAGPGNYHLHFEITTTADPKRYWGGVSHNPYPLLRKGITVM